MLFESYAVGTYTFSWHLDWSKQSHVLKAKFIMRLWKLYLGQWESIGVLEALGNNIREKRARLKLRFKVYDNHKVNRPRGCTIELWNKILQRSQGSKKESKIQPMHIESFGKKGFGALSLQPSLRKAWI